jgi:hypothetical protein
MGPGAPERSGSQPALSRVLFSPGRGTFGRGTGSSAGLPSRPAPGDATPSGALPVATPARTAARSASSNGSGLKTPISTARASAAATAPLPAPAMPGSGLAKARPRPRPEVAPAAMAAPAPGAATPFAGWHLRWIIAAGVVLVILCVAAVVGAYQLGKGTNRPGDAPPGGGGEVRPEARNVKNLAPGAGDLILVPEKAAGHVGEERTVEFRVYSVSHTDPPELGSGPPEEFAVRITPEFFASGGSRDVRGEYAGKRIRVRGKIEGDPATGLFIVAHDQHQIVPVAEK